MSKVRIESKWYHESPNFNLVAVDALSYSDQYIKIALFELHTPVIVDTTSSTTTSGTSPLPDGSSGMGGLVPPTRQYSVDIGTNIAESAALGIDGSPSTYSAKVRGRWFTMSYCTIYILYYYTILYG